MELSKLREIEERYWEGLTSEEEEEYLRREAQKKNTMVSDGHIIAFFSDQSANKMVSLPDDFDSLILDKIQEPKQFWATRRFIVSIAASFLIIFSVFLFNEFEPFQTEELVTTEDTFNDTEEAYEEVKKALMAVSATMNTGTDHLSVFGEYYQAQSAIKAK